MGLLWRGRPKGLHDLCRRLKEALEQLNTIKTYSLCVDMGGSERAKSGGREGEGGFKETL